MSQNVSQRRKLTSKQTRAISALLANRTIAEAAEVVSVDQRTIYRWLANDEAFNVALMQAEGQVIKDGVRGLVNDMKQNFCVMREIRDDPSNNSGTRLRAAAMLDGSLLRWRELYIVESRIARLEVIYEQLFVGS